MTLSTAACSGDVALLDTSADTGLDAGLGVTTQPPTPEQGPPPLTALPPKDDFLASPAAVPSGPGNANVEAGAASPNEDVASADQPVAASGTLVAHAIVDSVNARAEPARDAEIVSTLAHPTERGVPLVFQVLAGPTDGWVEVLLPVRPNGSTGWVQVDDVELTRNRYRIDLDVGAHRLVLLRNDDVVLDTTVAIGTGATPTPIGAFYLTELLRPPDPDGPYGPFAYGLSGFSESLDSFNGGPGIIGIHGTNAPELLGQDVSHGCVRVDNDVIAEMATFLPLGTPVLIHSGEGPPSASGID